MTAKTRPGSAHWMLLAAFALLPTIVLAQQESAPSGPDDMALALAEAPKEPTGATEGPADETEGPADGVQVFSGMSILGNQEAPTSLVIVPWKSSEIGDAVGVSTILDDSRQPVDREVFMRSLSYFQIRSEDAQ